MHVHIQGAFVGVMNENIMFDRFKYMINIEIHHDIRIAVPSGAWILSSQPVVARTPDSLLTF
jgi:hypothetical protein